MGGQNSPLAFLFLFLLTLLPCKGWADGIYEQYINESSASSEIIVGDYTYELNEDGENTVTLVKFTATDSYSENVNVPATFEKDGKTYTVTQIGNGEKINVSELYYRRAVVNAIPNTVTKIGAHAFDFIRFVDGVIIPASVKSIGDAAFFTDAYSTTNVYNVTLKASEAFTVGEKIFGETSKLSVGRFSILTSSEDVANKFKQTSGWDTYKDYFIIEIVKNGLRYRKNGDGTGLTLMGFDEESTDAKDKVVVPAVVDGIPVTAIGSKAFMSKSNLTSLDLSQAINLTQIGEFAFDAAALTEVVIPAQVKTLGYCAFGDISSLTKVTFERESDFGEDVVYGAAFLGSDNLAEIYVPKDTKSIYASLFENRIENAEEKIKEIDNSIISDNLKYELNADGETVTVLGLADGLADDAKENVEIPATIKVGDKDCKVTAIADNAFNGNCPDVVTIGENVTSIGANAIPSPWSITFKGSNAPVLGENALGGENTWNNVGKYIIVPTNAAKSYREAGSWSSYKHVVLAEPFAVGDGLFSILDSENHTAAFVGYSGGECDEYSIPDHIDANGASYEVVGMKYIVGKEIKGMKKLTIPATITSIERGDLYLEPEGVKEIDFLCENPTAVSSEMTHLLAGIDAFYVHSQEALEKFQASVEQFEELKAKIQLAAEPITDAYYEYQLNEDGHTVTVVGIADNVTLQNEVWLRGIVSGSYVSYEVTGIAANVFAKMSGITHIHVPSSVSTIAANAFTGMTSGLKVYFDRTDDISGYSKDMFGTTEVSSINVPTESYADYYAQLTNEQEDENKIGISSSLADGQGVDNLAQGLYPEGELKYTRTITEEEKGGYITTCLPFQINLSDAQYEGLFAGVWTFTPQVTYKDDGRYYINLQKIEGGMVDAGTPMLLKLNADVEEVSFYNAEALKNDGNLDVQPTDASISGKTDVTIQYSGTYMKKTDCESVYSFNVDATFGKHNGSTLNPFRAYLTIVDASGNAVQNASFYSSLNPGGGTTGINGVAADTVGAKAAIYSIDGKLVRKAGDSKSLAKGVYIIGGKKLVVK